MPIDNDEYKRLLNKAAAYAAKAERSPQEVTNKLQSWAHEPLDEESERKIMAALRQDRFVDEERYARRYTADKVRFLRKGPLLLRRELQQKGIPSAIIEQALAEVSDEVWAEALEQYLEGKIEGYRKKSRSPYQLRSRLMQAAYMHGYLRETSEEVLSRLDLSVEGADDDHIEWYD